MNAMSEIMPKQDNGYSGLIQSIGQLLGNARAQIAANINTVMAQTYWHIGKYIVEYQQKGTSRAGYGEELLISLSKDLTLKFGKGFSRSNLTYLRKFFLAFPKCETLSHKLSWRALSAPLAGGSSTQCRRVVSVHLGQKRHSMSFLGRGDCAVRQKQHSMLFLRREPL